MKFSGVMVDLKITAVNKELGGIFNMTIPIEISNEEQELFVNGIGVNIVDLQPGHEIDEQFTGAGGAQSAGCDKDIWKHWDKQEKSLFYWIETAAEKIFNKTLGGADIAYTIKLIHTPEQMGCLRKLP